MTNNELWQAVLAELELSISRANFVTWFKNTGIISNREGLVILCVPNAFTKAWLEKKYHQIVIKSLERITEKPIKKLDYKIDNIKNIAEQPIIFQSPAKTPDYNLPFAPAPGRATGNEPGGAFIINPKYTFDNFVVGGGSELAYA